MVSATPQIVDRSAYLYGIDPAKNIALTRAQSMTDDDLVSAGYRQAFKYGTMNGSLSSNPHYLQGWGAGYAARRAS
jgi:hypothetical protein